MPQPYWVLLFGKLCTIDRFLLLRDFYTKARGFVPRQVPTCPPLLGKFLLIILLLLCPTGWCFRPQDYSKHYDCAVWDSRVVIYLQHAVIFVDNSGADVVLGILPFARELLQQGTKVWLLMAQRSFYDVHVVLHIVSLCTQKNILGCQLEVGKLVKFINQLSGLSIM